VTFGSQITDEVRYIELINDSFEAVLSDEFSVVTSTNL